MVPAHIIPYLAVLTSVVSVHAEPFQDSTFVTLVVVYPAITKASVEVPKEPVLFLAVFISLTSVQLVPFHDSVRSLLLPS